MYVCYQQLLLVGFQSPDLGVVLRFLLPVGLPMDPRKSITGRSQGAELSTILSLLEELLDAELTSHSHFNIFQCHSVSFIWMIEGNIEIGKDGVSMGFPIQNTLW